MREINECTAEVFRRSEKRIKERKRNRNRILALCIPLCLIVTVWSVTILPAMLPAGKDSAAEGMMNDTAAEDSAGSIVCSYTEVEVQGEGDSPEYYEKITDKVEITKIFSAVHAHFPEKDDAVQDGMEPDGEAAEDNDDKIDSTNRTSGYVITFSDADGNQTVYNLHGNDLLNVNTDETVTLTNHQVAELKEALGLTD